MADDGSTITIQPGQTVGQLQGYDVYICKADEQTGSALTDEPLVLTVDAMTGIISSRDMVGLYDEQGLWTYCGGFDYIPVEGIFNDPVERPLTGEGQEYDWSSSGMATANVSSSVEDYYSPILDMHLMFGMINYYPQSCVVLQGNNDNTYGLGFQAIYDDYGDCIFASDAPYDGQTTPDITAESTFTYDPVTDTFTQADGDYIVDLYGWSYDNINILFDSDFYYKNLKIGAAPLSGIGSVDADKSLKEVVSTKYYDISGRQTNSAANGISIKVTKYADGTSKASKVILRK